MCPPGGRWKVGSLKDTSCPHCCDAVLWAAREGITNGTGAAAFSPDVSCTRAQMVTFLYRCLAL